MPNKKRVSTKSRVKNLRLALGYSQRKFAKEFRVSASAVAHWEAGEREISGPVSKLLELYEIQIRSKATAVSAALKHNFGGAKNVG